MSYTRQREGTGWVWKSRQRGPNGRGICRYCGAEVAKGRRTFCSETCVDLWRIGSDPGYARAAVYKRDRGVCSRCHRDMEAAQHELRLLLDTAGLGQFINGRDLPRGVPWDPTVKDWDKTWWEAHHTLPVSAGGGGCGLEGYETLCYRCHQAETREMRRERARRRRGENTHERGQMELAEGGAGESG